MPDPRAIKVVGFVGLGQMGLPMAARLAEAGYDVRGFDISQAARDALWARAPAARAAGSRVVHVGTLPGAGHALKALNNLVSAIHMLATSEAMLAGQRFGLDPAVMLDVINASSGRSGSSQNKWPNYVLSGGYDSGFAMRLQVKDAVIGLTIERESGIGAQFAELAVELWRRAANWLPADADHTEIVRWLEQAREGLADAME